MIRYCNWWFFILDRYMIMIYVSYKSDIINRPLCDCNVQENLIMSLTVSFPILICFNWFLNRKLKIHHMISWSSKTLFLESFNYPTFWCYLVHEEINLSKSINMIGLLSSGNPRSWLKAHFSNCYIRIRRNKGTLSNQRNQSYSFIVLLFVMCNEFPFVFLISQLNIVLLKKVKTNLTLCIIIIWGNT